MSNLVESCQTLSNLVFLHFKIFLSHFFCIFNFEICSLICLWLFSFSTYIQSCPVQSLPIFLPAQPFRLFFQSCFIVRWNEETRVLLRIILIFCPKYHIFLDKKDWKKRKWPLGIFRFLKTFWTIKIFRMIQLLQNFRIFKNVQKLVLFVCLFMQAPEVTNRNCSPQWWVVPIQGFYLKPKNN